MIGPPSRIAIGSPVAGSLRTTTALIAGRPRARCWPRTRRPTSSRAGRRDPSASRPRRNAGIAWANDPSGRGWTPILGGSSASATSAISVRSASAQPLLERRHRGDDVGGRRGSAGAAGRASASTRPVYAARSATIEADAPDRHRRRASTTSSSSATRSSSTTPSPTIEKDPRRAAAFRADRRQRAPPRRHLGDAS